MKRSARNHLRIRPSVRKVTWRAQPSCKGRSLVQPKKIFRKVTRNQNHFSKKRKLRCRIHYPKQFLCQRIIRSIWSRALHCQSKREKWFSIFIIQNKVINQKNLILEVLKAATSTTTSKPRRLLAPITQTCSQQLLKKLMRIAL